MVPEQRDASIWAVSEGSQNPHWLWSGDEGSLPTMLLISQRSLPSSGQMQPADINSYNQACHLLALWFFVLCTSVFSGKNFQVFIWRIVCCGRQCSIINMQTHFTNREPILSMIAQFNLMLWLQQQCILQSGCEFLDVPLVLKIFPVKVYTQLYCLYSLDLCSNNLL